jgi:hypothetical protein
MELRTKELIELSRIQTLPNLVEKDGTKVKSREKVLSPTTCLRMIAPFMKITTKQKKNPRSHYHNIADCRHILQVAYPSVTLWKWGKVVKGQVLCIIEAMKPERNRERH